MKSRTLIVVVVLLVSSLGLVRVVAEAPLAAWRYYADLNLAAAAPGEYDLLVPLQVMDQSQDELADLRLLDAAGKEIPYALRVRREIDSVERFDGTLFNNASLGNSASEVSVDLGENPGEHNEVQIETSGKNFRRHVNVEGADTGSDWKMLHAGAVIFGFESSNQVAESNTVSYPTSRYRYLRVRVFADELSDRAAPTILSVAAAKVVRAPGQLASWTVSAPAPELRRVQGANSSAWTIDLGGRVPVDRLALDVDQESFSRPFQLEVIDDPQNRQLIASGELARRAGEQRQPLRIQFDQEVHARKLRLLVTDYSNQTLVISSIVAGAPARQLVFDVKEKTSGPLRLFFGNYNAGAPHYDFEQDFYARPAQLAARTSLGSFFPNPDYKPEPLPFTERQPWLIYVVLAGSSIALALILLSLARATLRPLEPAGEPATEPNK
ncbi:MAG TPA: DUF3999 family protein [Pyrinomonadaceae bacterium]|nr:DUF3999 family protein [Pyrinomonadaceae bacterium]